MPIGLGTALLIGAGVSAGASLGGAYLASSASKNAANTQEQAAQQALALQQSIYNTQVARTQPYVDAGTTSLNNLMAKYWGTPFNDQVASYTAGGRAAGYGYATPTAGTLSSAPSTTTGGAPLPANAVPSTGWTTPNGTVYPQGIPGMQVPSVPGAPASYVPMNAPVIPPGGGGAPGSGGVLMRAPTGETSMVPQNLVQQFIQKGAQVVQQPQPQAPMHMAGTLGAVA